MSNGENMNNTGTEKKFEIKSVIPTILIGGAFIVTAIGLVRNSDFFRNLIYGFQSLSCILIFVFGMMRAKEKDGTIFKYVLFVYAALEAFRSALLNTIGVHQIPAVMARFLLALLACTCVLVAERTGTKKGFQTAIAMVILEMLLYIVFLVGFPGVMLGHLNRFMPLVGVLVAMSIMFIQKERSE
jgi:hypothetical protein